MRTADSSWQINLLCRNQTFADGRALDATLLLVCGRFPFPNYSCSVPRPSPEISGSTYSGVTFRNGLCHVLRVHVSAVSASVPACPPCASRAPGVLVLSGCVFPQERSPPNRAAALTTNHKILREHCL